jgi:fimbrial chaperone protein
MPNHARTLLPATAALLASAAALAGDFSVTPIRAQLGTGAMSETITVINHATESLRVTTKLVRWEQDANGNDVFTDSDELVYFPRQLDIDPEGKKLVRVGAKTPGAVTERAYRLFIEEVPPPPPPGRAQVAFQFRFGVPVFVAPAQPKAVPEVAEPTLTRGRLAVVVKNTGNTHFRLSKVTMSDGGSWSQELAGWYSLAGSQRSYGVDVPAEVCRRAPTLRIALEGENLRIDRQLNVDPARCA